MPNDSLAIYAQFINSPRGNDNGAFVSDDHPDVTTYTSSQPARLIGNRHGFKSRSSISLHDTINPALIAHAKHVVRRPASIPTIEPSPFDAQPIDLPRLLPLQTLGRYEDPGDEPESPCSTISSDSEGSTDWPMTPRTPVRPNLVSEARSLDSILDTPTQSVTVKNPYPICNADGASIQHLHAVRYSDTIAASRPQRACTRSRRHTSIVGSESSKGDANDDFDPAQSPSSSVRPSEPRGNSPIEIVGRTSHPLTRADSTSGKQPRKQRARKRNVPRAPEKRDAVARQKQNQKAQKIYRDQVKNLGKVHMAFSMKVIVVLADQRLDRDEKLAAIEALLADLRSDSSGAYPSGHDRWLAQVQDALVESNGDL